MVEITVLIATLLIAVAFVLAGGVYFVLLDLWFGGEDSSEAVVTTARGRGGR